MFYSRSAQSGRRCSLVDRSTGSVTPLCPAHRAAFVERGLSADQGKVRHGLRREAVAWPHCSSLEPGAEELALGRWYAEQRASA